MGKKKKIQESISDEDLKAIIKDRLKKDPIHYTDFLKELIDSLPVRAITPKTFFELLTFNLLFYPEVRKTLKKWQQTCLNERLDPNQKEKAKKARDYLRQVGKALVSIGQGRPKAISKDTELKIRYDVTKVDRLARKAEKKPLIKEGLLTESEKFPSPEVLRNRILAKRYKISIRQVEETLRKLNKEITWLRQELGYKPTDIDEEENEGKAEELTEEDNLMYEDLLKAEGDDFDRKWKEIFKQHIFPKTP